MVIERVHVSVLLRGSVHRRQWSSFASRLVGGLRGSTSMTWDDLVLGFNA